MRIAFVTTTPDVLKGEDVDREIHEAAFAAADVTLDHCIWWDRSVQWRQYDLVVVRSPWDYVERLAEFRQWLHQMDAMGTLRNPAQIVEWNLDKRYLAELAAEGLPVVSTRFASSTEEVVEALSSRDGEVVIKPVVSAGSRNTGRFASGDPRAVALAQKILAEDVTVMIQPCITSVEAAGEVSAVLFNGVISHALRKGAILASGGGYIDGEYSERIAPASLTGQQEKVVGDATEILARMGAERFGSHTPLLYARVDLVTLEDGGDVVLEVELAEPSFFLAMDPHAPKRFVAAVKDHVVAAAG